MSFNFTDKKDQTIYFISYNYLGSTTYDGNDLKMNRIDFFIMYLEISLAVSNDYIFVSDYFYMFQVTKNSNYSEPNMWISRHNMVHIKLYEDTGQ